MRKPGLPSLDDKLDEALKQTFPASDAFALFPETAVEPTVLNESTRQPGKRTVRRENASPTHRRRGHDDGEEAAIERPADTEAERLDAARAEDGESVQRERHRRGSPTELTATRVSEEVGRGRAGQS